MQKQNVVPQLGDGSTHSELDYVRNIDLKECCYESKRMSLARPLFFFCQLQKEIATKDEAKNTDLKKKGKLLEFGRQIADFGRFNHFLRFLRLSLGRPTIKV